MHSSRNNKHKDCCCEVISVSFGALLLLLAFGAGDFHSWDDLEFAAKHDDDDGDGDDASWAEDFCGLLSSLVLFPFPLGESPSEEQGEDDSWTNENENENENALYLSQFEDGFFPGCDANATATATQLHSPQRTLKGFSRRIHVRVAFLSMARSILECMRPMNLLSSK